MSCINKCRIPQLQWPLPQNQHCCVRWIRASSLNIRKSWALWRNGIEASLASPRDLSFSLTQRRFAMLTPNCSLAKMLQSPEREGNTTWNNNIMSSRIGSIGTYQIHPNPLIWVLQKVWTKDKQLRLKRTPGLSRLQGVKRLAYRCLDSAEIPFHQQESMRFRF